VRLLIAGEGQAMLDQSPAERVIGSQPRPVQPRSVGRARGTQTNGHDFEDPELYARMNSECRRIYARAYGAISERDWKEAFNYACGQAWYTEQKEGRIDHLATWLAKASYYYVVSQYRKGARVDLVADEGAFTEGVISDPAETVDDRQLLRDAVFCLKTCLPERVRLVWTMRFAGDYEPDEIQRRLKISKKAYEKDLERGSKLVVSRLESARQSGVCDTPDMASMVRAYAIWGEQGGAERAKLAREHIDHCSACRQTVRALRVAQRAAAFLPPPFLIVLQQPRSPLGVIWQRTDDVALRVQDGLLRMKQFVVNLISRSPTGASVNPDRAATVIGASGGGALVTKAVAGCLAAGVLAGGTGACLKAAGVSVPGLNGVIASVTGGHSHHGHGASSHPAWSGPAENLTLAPSATELQGIAARPARAAPPTKPAPPPRPRAVRRAPSSVVAAREDFGAPPASRPQPSQAEVSAARSEFSSPTNVARTATSNGGSSVQAAPRSEPHTNGASTKAAEAEFSGP
jgi:DNA-directed RNA polymerase specialized sigma24 family protein